MSLDLEAIRKRVKAAEEESWFGYEEEARADVTALLDELERVRALHQEEQRRSADRLRAALDLAALVRNAEGRVMVVDEHGVVIGEQAEEKS